MWKSWLWYNIFYLKLKTAKYSAGNCNNLCTDKQVFKYKKHSN